MLPQPAPCLHSRQTHIHKMKSASLSSRILHKSSSTPTPNNHSSDAIDRRHSSIEANAPVESVRFINDRRRSSASEITMDVATAIRATPNQRKSSIIEKGASFIYSKTWKERKKQKKKEKEKNDQEGSYSDEQIVLNRELSRRQRNSFLTQPTHPSMKHKSATDVSKYLAARVEAEKPVVVDIYDHSSAISKAVSKGHMLDVRLKGSDGVNVSASSFILACYSPVLEEAFFKKKKLGCYDEKKQKLTVDYANSEVLKAAVHHCFTGELPEDFDVLGSSEDMARSLAQLDRFAATFQMRALGEVSYRAARKLINRRAVLACAVFDELSGLEGVAGFDSIKGYALDTIRVMPMDTLLGGGVHWMNEQSLELIMQDQDMDVDEFYMFKILNAWEQGAHRVENRIEKARKMASSIELKFISLDLLNSQIKNSGYFDDATVSHCIRAVEDTLANMDPHEMERVIVEGAGLDIVNGIYLRVHEELGLNEEDILFIKEADDGIRDVGLFLYRDNWNIAMCTDYSNVFYTCINDPKKQITELVPRDSWTVCDGGTSPVPMCTYIPNTRALRSSVNTVLAPNLEEMIDPTIAEKRRSGFFDRAQDDTVEKRTMTLEQMMNLPEDREHDLAASSTTL